MVPSTGVHEPQREPWLVTQRTPVGFATPPRYCRDSSAARRPSSPSPRAARRALRRSCVANRSSMIAIQRCSSARDIRAGSSTMVRSPSRYADTVRRRRALRRTSTGPTGTSLPVTATPAPYRRCATPARHHAQAAQSCRFLSHPQHGSPSALVAAQVTSRGVSACTPLSRPVHRNTPARPHPAHSAVHRPAS